MEGTYAQAYPTWNPKKKGGGMLHGVQKTNLSLSIPTTTAPTRDSQ